MAIRITCINKSGGYHHNPYAAINRLGWVNEANGQSGYSSRIEMYDFVVNKQGEAYVRDAMGNRAYLIGAISPNGTSYVKTVADETKSDNLLSLMDCQV